MHNIHDIYKQGRIIGRNVLWLCSIASLALTLIIALSLAGRGYLLPFSAAFLFFALRARRIDGGATMADFKRITCLLLLNFLILESFLIIR